MENSTKTLLIVAAVLIVIILICLAISIVKNTSDLKDADQKTGELLYDASDAAAESVISELENRRIKEVVSNAKQSGTSLGDELKKQLEEGSEVAIVGESGYIVVYNGREYKLDKNGSIISNKRRTEQISYEFDGQNIKCIEDLVEWSKNYKNYKNNNIFLEITLDFEDNNSYIDCMTTNYGDVNGNETVEPLIQELTTDKGFVPIAEYAKTFDGQTNEIRNILINRSYSYMGFINKCSGTIKNFGISGNIQNSVEASNRGGVYYSGTAGIVGVLEGKIDNCYNLCKVKGQVAGGIIGKNNKAYEIISNCINYGDINSTETAGGIAGAGCASDILLNCKNFGKIWGSAYAGGILGHAYLGDHGNVCICNCYNKGNVNSTYAGGIVGYHPGTNVFLNCYNTSSISGTSYAGGIIGYVYSSMNCKNCYQTGNITGTTVEGTTGAKIYGKVQFTKNLENIYNENNDIDEIKENFNNIKETQFKNVNISEFRIWYVNSEGELDF